MDEGLTGENAMQGALVNGSDHNLHTFDFYEQFRD